MPFRVGNPRRRVAQQWGPEPRFLEWVRNGKAPKRALVRAPGYRRCHVIAPHCAHRRAGNPASHQSECFDAADPEEAAPESAIGTDATVLKEEERRLIP